MAPFPGWTSTSNFSVVVQKLQNHFGQYPPLMPKQSYQVPNPYSSQSSRQTSPTAGQTCSA